MSRLWQGTIWIGHKVVAWGDDESEAKENMYARRAQDCPNCMENADMDEVTDVEVIDSPSMRRMGLVKRG